MTEQQPLPLSGTLIRGADGALYFIVDQEIPIFRVPDGAIDAMEELMEQSQLAEDDEAVVLEARRVVVADAHAIFGCQHKCWHSGDPADIANIDYRATDSEIGE
jgi:hypothetical protein